MAGRRGAGEADEKGWKEEKRAKKKKRYKRLCRKSGDELVIFFSNLEENNLLFYF